MTSSHRILVVVETRPEAVKPAPVIRRLRREPDRFQTVVCATAQHREMLDQVLVLFGIEPDGPHVRRLAREACHRRDPDDLWWWFPVSLAAALSGPNAPSGNRQA